MNKFKCSMNKKKESLSKKSEASIESLKDKVVSDGTLKPEDLIPKFLNALKHDETAHAKFLKDNPEILEIQSWDDVDDETKSMLVDELTDALNSIAPDGYCFGASDGDGACFGFWKVEPDESKKPEACKGGKDDDKKDGKDGKATESKKSEGVSGTIKMNIDYNTFMRLLDAAAYLDASGDYKDALWEYYSEFGELDGEACEFFDNLFQYTSWGDADYVYDECLSDKYKDESKSKAECIEAAIDDGDVNAYKHESGNYLVIL